MVIKLIFLIAMQSNSDIKSELSPKKVKTINLTYETKEMNFNSPVTIIKCGFSYVRSQFLWPQFLR